VGAGTCEFTIAYTEAPSPLSNQLDVYAARVLRDGTVATNHRLVDGQQNALRDRLVISSRQIHDTNSNLTNRTLIAWENGNPFDGVVGQRFEPVTASVNPFGTACPGPLGELAAIGTSGGTPYAGNSAFAITITDGPANSLAVLAISDQLASNPLPGAPGCTVYGGAPIVLLPILTDNLGDGAMALPMPCSIPHGLTLACQWGIYSPTANAFGWVLSNDVDISWYH
jgi:hypothetical protein